MPLLARPLVLLCLAGLPGLACAQIYMCKDANGRTITSDRPIPECATRAVRELGNDGVVRREIAAPLTPAQRQQQQRDVERQKAEADALVETRRRDMAILERFRSEAEIQAARKRAVTDVGEKIRQEQVMAAQADKQFKDATAEAERHKQKEVVPVFFRQKVELAQNAVRLEEDLMRQHRLELLKVDGWFDETLRRYRELTGAAPSR